MLVYLISLHYKGRAGVCVCVCVCVCVRVTWASKTLANVSSSTATVLWTDLFMSVKLRRNPYRNGAVLIFSVDSFETGTW